MYVARLKEEKNLLKIIIGAGLLISVSLVLFSYSTYFPLSLFLIMMGECGLLTFVASTNTFLQTHVEEHMRGRVISYYVMAFGGMIPIGSLIIGLLAHVTSAPFTLLIEGLMGILIIALFIPLFKKIIKEQHKKQRS